MDERKRMLTAHEMQAIHEENAPRTNGLEARLRLVLVDEGPIPAQEGHIAQDKVSSQLRRTIEAHTGQCQEISDRLTTLLKRLDI